MPDTNSFSMDRSTNRSVSFNSQRAKKLSEATSKNELVAYSNNFINQRDLTYLIFPRSSSIWSSSLYSQRYLCLLFYEL